MPQCIRAVFAARGGPTKGGFNTVADQCIYNKNYQNSNNSNDNDNNNNNKTLCCKTDLFGEAVIAIFS